jgi:hypothetical protein
MARIITNELFKEFYYLLMELEPENLCMDGEATEEQVISREKSLWRKWVKLEKYVGREVSQEEIWDISTKEATNA